MLLAMPWTVHLAREIRGLVDLLRLDDLFATYAGVGRKAYRPDLMLRVVLYEMHLGHRSPAEWHRWHARENGPAWMAKTSSGREDQHRRYQAAGVLMCRRHRENAQRPADRRRAIEKIKISIGDPEAPLSINKEKVFRPLYNVQLEYDLESPLILAYDVFAQCFCTTQ